MIVYSNTTPFISLSSINRLDILPAVFGSIYTPEAVIEECSYGGKIFVPNLSNLEWIVPVKNETSIEFSVLFELDKGEKQTLLLAVKNKADLVIIDEQIGRQTAEYLGLKVVGTLGVLAKAKQMGLIESFTKCAKQVQEQGIYYNNSLISKISRTIGET